MLIIVKCWRLGRKAHGNCWENCKQFWCALNQALSGTVPGHNAWDRLKHISLCCSKGSVYHGKLTGLSTVTQSVSFFALCLAQFWPRLTSCSQLITKHHLGDYCGPKALPKRYVDVATGFRYKEEGWLCESRLCWCHSSSEPESGSGHISRPKV